MRLLLAEDDTFLAEGLVLALQDSGYSVDVAKTGIEADSAISVTDYHLLILDLGLPLLDGTEVLKKLRERGNPLPVIVLTAREGLEHCINSLDLGANDFLAKPFQLPELEARIRALLRKNYWQNQVEVIYGPLKFNTATRIVTIKDVPVDLSAREVAALEIMLQPPERIISKSQIAEHLSSWEINLTLNAVEIVIHRLRKKLENSGIKIKTIRELGYQLEKTE